jgi:FixJ family two-component response regulator
MNERPSENPTVYVVDDDPAARDSVAAMVSSKGLAVATFESAEEFLASYNRSHSGCLVADLRMDGMDGLQLQQRLIEKGIGLPVILISAFASVPTAVIAMNQGAVTFLEKPCGNHELWTNIRKAIDRDRQQRSEQAARDDVARRLVTLTQPERDVLECLRRGLMNKVIASKLDIGLRTVELRRANIMKKMEADSLANLLKTVMSSEPDQDDAPANNAAPSS